MTFELWIKPNGGNSILFDSPSNGGDSQLLLNNDGSISAQRGGNGSWNTGPTYLFDGNWHHLAVATPDSNNWAVYLNGTSVPVNGSGPCYLLGPTFGTDPFLLGLNAYVAEFRLWNIQCSQQQIQNNMGSQLSPQANLVGLWNFSNQNANDATGTFSTDGGGNGGFQSTDVPVFANDSADVAAPRHQRSPRIHVHAHPTHAPRHLQSTCP